MHVSSNFFTKTLDCLFFPTLTKLKFLEFPSTFLDVNVALRVVSESTGLYSNTAKIISEKQPVYFLLAQYNYSFPYISDSLTYSLPY